MAVQNHIYTKTALTVDELINRLEELEFDVEGLQWETHDGIVFQYMTVYNPFHEHDEINNGMFESLSFDQENGTPAIILMLDGLDSITETWEEYTENETHFTSFNYIFNLHNGKQLTLKYCCHAEV